MEESWWKIWVGFCIIAAIISGFVTFNQWSDCNAQRGVFVKTAVWYDCIEKGQH